MAGCGTWYQKSTADDIGALREFLLKSGDVRDEEVRRPKTILTSRTFSDVERARCSGAPSTDVVLVPGDLLVDDEFDEELAMRKKLAKQKQQSRKRDRKSIRVLRRLGQCYMLQVFFCVVRICWFIVH